MTNLFYPARPKGIDPLLEEHRKAAEGRELDALHPKAALSQDHQRLDGAEEDHRLPYKRDVDRIVHSKAYARYVDKTQVAYLVDTDHITRRSMHVQLVSTFARGIAEILRLNIDLVEAVALGHDVGHPPFGHEGEKYLSCLSEEMGCGAFAHSRQSCRLFREIEPLNLGLNVYDGFLCHDGGFQGTRYTPQFGKDWAQHEADLLQKGADPDGNIWPGTLEGCLVKFCDTASYLGRDIEDGVRMGLLKREDVPETILGRHNREILSVLAADIIRSSYEKDFIALSDEVYESLKILRTFNFERIYTHPQLKTESRKVERSYRIVCETLLADHEKLGEASHLWRFFGHNKPGRYLEETSGPQMVIDFVSGMTDSFFIRTLESLVLPQKIQIK